MKFSHLHVHTTYSLLDGASSIQSILKKASKDEMPAVAITDHGNLFGVFEFVVEAYAMATHCTNPIKPIVGCEFYLTQNTAIKDKTTRFYHQLLLAKNDVGYKNLLKLSQMSYTEGFYRKPCIDKEMIKNHHEGLIATSCCLGSLVARTLHEQGEAAAEQELKWWIELFGDDYYLELQRHQLAEQERLNAFLVSMSKKYKTKLICTNDSHYTEQDFAELHEILLCINTGSFMRDPVKNEEDIAGDGAPQMAEQQGKKVKHRFAFPNQEFFFKTTAEMQTLFHDIPEALDHTNEIVDKIDKLDLKRDILLPHFDLPTGFHSQNEYLWHLARQGLARKYQEVTPEIQERLEFEMGVIEKMDYCGYFLIVADFIKVAKEMGVSVGPGRGSAAGSLVAYLIDITNVDPIKYQLLFERFLNPERRGMPDIDIDFDDAGRGKVIDYIMQRYGKNRTAQIVTFNTMAAKSAIKDVARVLEYDYSKSNQLSKLIASNRSIHEQIEATDEDEEHKKLNPQSMDNLKKLRQQYAEDEEIKTIIDYAKGLEGGIRNVGIHAAGIIITPQDVETMIPVFANKGNDMIVSQIEGKYIESAGVMKMDILGLSNLNTIRTCLALVEKRQQKKIDISAIPLDDELTYELYQRGETVGTFQFESDGMRKYLRDLKPDRFEDLIALNALYRPGPMAYIPEYIKRKHGLKTVEYDLPELEPILKETYGITVYQEQVMLLAQLLAGFSKGDADVLRKAMGKKQRETLDKMQRLFLEGAKAKNHPEGVLKKIWSDWVSFAEYAFNKAHSTCYALLAYRTAYLKANYPHEYMTALLEGSKDITEQAKIIAECKRMGIQVLGPSVNESLSSFSITEKEEIRFGLSAIKGLGDKDSELIVGIREKQGTFKDVFDFSKAMEGQLGGGKLESLVKAGALDCFALPKRPQYLTKMSPKGETFIDTLVAYGKASKMSASKQQNSLQLCFDLSTDTEGNELGIPLPKLPDNKAQVWTELETLKYEQEALGTYLSSHPLSSYKFEFEHCLFTSLSQYKEAVNQDSSDTTVDIKALLNTSFLVGGIVESVHSKTTQKGVPYITLSINDFSESHEFAFFSNDLAQVQKIAAPDAQIYIQLRFRADKYNPEKLRSYVVSAGLLADFREHHIKELHLHLNEEHLTPNFIYFLSTYIESQKNQGKSQLFLHTYLDKNTSHLSIRLPSKVPINHELVAFIESQNHLLCRTKLYNT